MLIVEARTNGKKQALRRYLRRNRRTNQNKYRPVSLTSVVYKLLETLIRDNMVEFLAKHKLINTSQHGFLKARSYITNLLCFLEEITKWVDDGSPVDGNYVSNWRETSLTYRRQRIMVDDEISKWKSVVSGLPHGSVLGPIIFLIYIQFGRSLIY